MNIAASIRLNCAAISILIEKSLFNLGFKDKVAKWLNPDATTADLGDKMEAYYDEKLKVWVFPGEDPAEKAKPIGPPPRSVQATTKNDAKEGNSSSNTSKLDPLAAMMAPPRRGPSALPRSRTHNSSVPPSPASMPMMFPMGIDIANSAQPLPKFNVFTPPPAPASHDHAGNDDAASTDRS